MTVPIGPGPRVLQVVDGRLWLTAPGTVDEPSTDFWLVAGESLELPEGVSVVMEAWSDTRFELLVPPKACRPRANIGQVLTRVLAGLGRHVPSAGRLAARAS